jgi:hypothetical protein
MKRKANQRPMAYDFELKVVVRGYGDTPDQAFEGVMSALNEDFDEVATIEEVVFDNLGDAQATLLMGAVEGVQ